MIDRKIKKICKKCYYYFVCDHNPNGNEVKYKIFCRENKGFKAIEETIRQEMYSDLENFINENMSNGSQDTIDKILEQIKVYRNRRIIY